MKRLLIVISIVTLLLCGCGKKGTKETENTQHRFVLEYRQTFDGVGTIRIIRDTETGKAYLFAKDYNAGGLTILDEGE